MGLTHRRLSLEAVSQPGFLTFGDPVRVRGQSLDVQFSCPIANNVGLEVSNDRATWHFATDVDGADLNGTAFPIAVDDYRVVREQPEWVRLWIWFDNGGPRAFRALVGVHKRTN